MFNRKVRYDSVMPSGGILVMCSGDILATISCVSDIWHLHRRNYADVATKLHVRRESNRFLS